MSRKDKNIPSWQKSTFDQSSRVETKPISVKAIKKIEKEFYQKNKEAMKIKDPDLYEFFKAEFDKKKTSKIKLKVKSKPDLNTVSCKDIKREEHLNFRCPDDVKQENELSKYQKEREIERKKKLNKLRQDQNKTIKFETFRKDPHRGMGWVDARSSINTGKLGHSQSWKHKKEKKYVYY